MRHGMAIRLHRQKVQEYRRLHAAVWPGVLKALSNNGIEDFTSSAFDRLPGLATQMGHASYRDFVNQAV